MWSKDALTQWKRLFAAAFEFTGARALIVPVIEYDGRVARTSDGDGTYREPVFIARGDSEMNITEQFVLRAAPFLAGTDVALSSWVTLLFIDNIPVLRRFDVLDVEPGHVFHPSDPLLERYVALRTTSSYHLYTKGDPFGAAGGICVADSKWKKAFLRITERKGAIAAVNAPPEPTPPSDEVGF